MKDELFERITKEMKEAAEQQIADHHKIIDYDTREYPVEVIVEKYLTGIEDDENDFYVPDYQRDLTWPDQHQSRFIESVLMGLPIPLLFFADVAGKDGRAEIVDGSQRVRTLARFTQGNLRLAGLERLTHLNGFTYNDLPPARKRRFGRHTVRMIEMREGVDEESRRDIFSRINTGTVGLNPMELRWGTSDGTFLRFIRKCSQESRFEELVPLSKKAIKLREPQEFALRFFAYLDNYRGFDRSVIEFLNDYLKKTQEIFDEEAETVAQREWNKMLEFAKAHLHSFAKKQGHVRTPRIRFEAISVGIALALRQQPDLIPRSMDWLESDAFKAHMRSDASNSRPKVIARIEFVRDHLLES
jgi:Protein of unknown function DUF262